MIHRASSTTVMVVLGIALAALSACSGKPSKPPEASALSGPASSDLLTEVRHRGSLLIATDANYSPQSKLQPEGTWTGFDVEVGREIAHRLGVTPVFVSADFNLVVRGNWLGRWDVDIGSMSITPSRSKVLWFTAPYYIVPASFVVKTSSSVHDLSDLTGKRIGVTGSTVYQAYLQGRGEDPKVRSLHLVAVPYDIDIHALRDLTQGSSRSIDAVLTSLPTINAAIASGMPLRALHESVFNEKSAIALDRSGFRQPLSLLWAIDGILQSMHRDGTLRRLSLQYYRTDLSGTKS
jgi:polar amino acid transport system substrate-binding protein